MIHDSLLVDTKTFRNGSNQVKSNRSKPDTKFSWPLRGEHNSARPPALRFAIHDSRFTIHFSSMRKLFGTGRTKSSRTGRNLIQNFLGRYAASTTRLGFAICNLRFAICNSLLVDVETFRNGSNQVKSNRSKPDTKFSWTLRGDHNPARPGLSIHECSNSVENVLTRKISLNLNPLKTF